MITRLKTRPRLDALDNQRRGAGKKLGRRIYFGLLIGLFTAMVYYFIGARFVLDADGIVTKERYLLAAEYDSRIIKKFVQPGDNVNKGQPLLQLDSRDIANKLSDFDSRRAELDNQLEEVKALIANAQRLLPLAKVQEEQAKTYASKLEKLFKRGLTTLSTRNEAKDLYFVRQRDVAALNGEFLSASKRRKTIISTLGRLDSVISDTTRIFDAGALVSPVDGIVGPVVPSIGQVNTRGESVLELFIGTPFILAYLPTDRMYLAEIGTEVAITDGYRTARGRIVGIGGLTDNVPAEFQSTLKRRERDEIFKIAYEGVDRFVLGSTVKVSSTYGISGIFDRLRSAFSDSNYGNVNSALPGTGRMKVAEGNGSLQ